KMANSATVNGTINSINKAQRTATINRDAIPKWQRDSAIMEFVFAGNIDLENLSAAQQVSLPLVCKTASLLLVILTL
ncbi:MAG: copper-binding protein, partial [Pseudoalteromonas sp.]